MKFIITGGHGFIGSNLVKFLVDNLDFEVLNIDNLSYASNTHFLENISNKKNYKFELADIRDKKKVEDIFAKFKPNKIIHLAAQTHVDRSIDSSIEFIEANILGTYNLLEISLHYFRSLSDNMKNNFTFHHISTDEVYGDLGDSTELFSEESPYKPSSPYSASKAASDHLVHSWNRTYRLPTLISNCSNNYGPNQHAEKLIPLTILRALEGKSLPIYGTGNQVRDWLYVEDHVRAIVEISLNADSPEYFNIGANNEKTNLEVVNKICSILDKMIPSKKNKNQSYTNLIEFVDDRPGHDKRYAINAHKLKNILGWSPQVNFEDGIKSTVNWYIENRISLATNSKSLEESTKRRGLIK